MFVYFDIGGTKTRVSISHNQEDFCEPVKFDTPHDLQELYGKIHDTARELGGNEPFVGAGGGIACPVDRSTNRLGWAPNLPKEWFDHLITDELGALLECPVFMDNDTAVIGMGEAHHGAARGAEIAVYMTISTGVGGARIVRGMPESVGMSAEPGRQYIDYTKSACPECEGTSTQEYLAGSSMERQYGCKPYEVTDPAVWEQMAEWAGYMLINTTVHWAPDVIVMGGSMIIGDPAIPVDRIEHHLQEHLVYPKTPVVKKAELGDFGGIYGAMEFVKHKLAV